MGFPRTCGQRAAKPSLRRAISAFAVAAVCLEPSLYAAQAYVAVAHASTRSTKLPDRRARVADISPWEAAERARDAFEATAEPTRSRADYSRVMDRFRVIYHDNPRDLHAPEAINAVAELLAEAGRDLHDPRSFRAAIGQYEFLRTQYPTCSLRAGALLAEGQIAENDLRDAALARERYQLLLKSYPRSALAEQARAGVASLASPAKQQGGSGPAAGPASALQTAATGGTAARSDGRSVRPQASPGRSVLPATTSTAARSLPSADAQTEQPAAAPSAASSSAASGRPQHTGEMAATHTAARRRDQTVSAPASTVDRTQPPVRGAVGEPSGPALPPPREVAHRSGPLASVSGIRHWSTASYTRVAIDLGSEVEYEAARVPSPDRIFFDLHGARLASDLVGKSFPVTDDGFLKRIRVSQSSPDVSRVVLDVNDVTEYSAFLLPNPYRLIIDIHGGTRPASNPQLASMDSPAPRTAAVPNTHAVRAGSPTDVNALSEQPGKVGATSAPTSQPISATVPGHAAEVSTLPPTSPSESSSSMQSYGPTNAATEVLPAGRQTVAVPSAVPSGKVSAADGRVVGDPRPAATARSVAAAKRGVRKGAGEPAMAADARVVGDPGTPARAAAKTADGQTSLVRALGLKINRIVIDAGHGGHDSGTLGAGGLQEKDVVLDVALRLGKLLQERLGAEVIYTRSDDSFIPLETRTAIANKAQADLFLSIHANSSPDTSARGVETYYLNFTQQADALEVAARENAVSGQSIHQLSDLVRKITLKDKIAESREFATDVETSLYAGLSRGGDGLGAGNKSFKDRGVKKAPFVVLIGANMPSILTEISFVTNPRDATQLRDPDYKQRVAESLYRGLARYVGSLSGGAPVPVVERASAKGQ